MRAYEDFFRYENNVSEQDAGRRVDLHIHGQNLTAAIFLTTVELARMAPRLQLQSVHQKMLCRCR